MKLRLLTCTTAVLVALLLSGCMTHETRPLQRINAIQASAEVPTDQLLDVAVLLFDENVPKDEKQLEKQQIFPEVRKAEARYFSMQLRNTLEGTGQWGQVRVVPVNANTLDVQVAGKIIDSSGSMLKLDVTVSDATRRVWFRKNYEQPADTRSYRDNSGRSRDPFQNLYSAVANDMLDYREKLVVADLQSVRRVSELRFASELAPYATKPHLSEDKKGIYRVNSLPADQDPIFARVERIRERDYALLDTVNEYYSLFADNMTEPYTNWRRYSYAEIEAADDAKRQSLTRKLLGAAAIVGGLVAGSQSNTYVGQAAATAAVFGGAYAVKSGFDKGAEVKMHSESLKQLGESFQAEIQPKVVEVDGKTVQLQGTAEQQYQEWRGLLKDLYENETGMPVQLPASTGQVPSPLPPPPASAKTLESAPAPKPADGAG
jgi:hypothetical protein